jgi:hypothetical protein
MEKNYILRILRSDNTVFTFKDIALIWGETNTDLAKKRIYRYVKAGKLYAIRRGIYAKDKNYDRFELATKIFTPSYISMETVLAKEGVIFQHHSQIFAASYLTRGIVADGQKYVFRKIKDSVLVNPLGIERKGNYSIATKERAFLDMLYLSKEYHFDNLTLIDWDKCFEMLAMYDNKTMAKRLNSYYKNAKS